MDNTADLINTINYIDTSGTRLFDSTYNRIVFKTLQQDISLYEITLSVIPDNNLISDTVKIMFQLYDASDNEIAFDEYENVYYENKITLESSDNYTTFSIGGTLADYILSSNSQYKLVIRMNEVSPSVLWLKTDKIYEANYIDFGNSERTIDGGSNWVSIEPINGMQILAHIHE